eukprot:TRINITY_DN74910_c0_g1_i1.p1 TRINITY_DN74910_c0_g1~~TRINITY_DN74910_c0_g1_i1.p1  ORF type:complete len:307 (-),score=40.19 TRINITY_DN74910_c0_g1_i1:738-1658(-)
MHAAKHDDFLQCDSMELAVHPVCLAAQESQIMRCARGEENARRIKQPWHRMNQFDGLDWGYVRRRVQHRLNCTGLGLVGLVRVSVDENGLWHLKDESDAYEWLAASIASGRLQAVVASDQHAERTSRMVRAANARGDDDCEPWEDARQHRSDGKQCSDPKLVYGRTGRLLFEPTITRDAGKLFEGEIDARGVRLMHGRKSPTWPKVLRYALLLEQQAASGSAEGPPPVQISRHLVDEDWVVHDGGHRLYAALLSGLPLRCCWKRRQRTWANLDKEERKQFCARGGLLDGLAGIGSPSWEGHHAIVS